MDLQLQFGYGMMEHCRSLLARWKGGTVILSPRDLSDTQLGKLAKDIRGIPGGSALLDPQFYLPHADHERLRSHSYWPQQYDTGAFWQSGALAQLLRALADLNRSLGTRAFILPGLLASGVDDDWLATQELVLTEAEGLHVDMPLITTIAVSAPALQSQDQLAALLEASERWPRTTCYVVAEHPNGRYLSDDPNWLANLLDLTGSLRMQGREVILGYSNHQMLIAGCAKVNALASGTWMNVRSFPPDKFRAAYEEEIKQRTTWYYCPQALSEYKIPFLDIAQRQNVLAEMAPPTGMDGNYSAALFAGAQPTAVGFTEQAAFRHYLECLRVQARSIGQASFDEAVSSCERMLDTAQSVLGTLTGAGVRGQLRDFSEIIDVNRAALAVFTTTRGPTLRRAWTRI